jgi:hypothetical protein
MTIQRKVQQMKPLCESAYFTRNEHKNVAPDSREWPVWVIKTFDHHVTLRIDVARLTQAMTEKAARTKTGRITSNAGLIRLTINTTKERP